MPTDDLQSAGEKRKRKSDSSEDESTLKPYECRFCPMKFAKSQALGGHMNRHRQEREREQLLHARQLVLQQGLSWVSGQNSKQLNSRIAAGPQLSSPSLQSNFQLSSSLQWNVASSQLPTKSDDESNNQGVMQQPGYSSHAQPYMVQHVPGSSFPGGAEMLPHHHLPPSALDCNSISYAGQTDEEHQQQLDANSVNLQLGADPSSSDFPSLQLGTGSTDMPPMPLSSDTMGQLHIAVEGECPAPPQQILSLGGYQQQSAFANEGYRNSMPTSYVDLMSAGSSAPWDGLSWIFNNQKPLPSTAEGFSLALGQSQPQQPLEHEEQQHLEHERQQHLEHEQQPRATGNCHEANGIKEEHQNGVLLEVEEEPGNLSLLSYSENRHAEAEAAVAATRTVVGAESGVGVGDLSLLNFSSSNDDDDGKPANTDRDNNNTLDVKDDNTRHLVQASAEAEAAAVGGEDTEVGDDENKAECVLGI